MSIYLKSKLSKFCFESMTFKNFNRKVILMPLSQILYRNIQFKLIESAFFDSHTYVRFELNASFRVHPKIWRISSISNLEVSLFKNQKLVKRLQSLFAFSVLTDFLKCKQTLNILTQIKDDAIKLELVTNS